MPDAKPLIVTAPIRIGNQLAYNVGDEIDPDVAKREGWLDSTARPGTKAAEAAVDAEA